LKIFQESEQEILFTQTALFIELIGCKYFNYEFLEKIHPSINPITDIYKTNVFKLTDKGRIAELFEEHNICSESSIKNNIENKLLFILMCMVSTTQAIFQYKKSDAT